MTTATTLPKRQDVPKEDTWSLETIYPDDQLWEEDFARVKARCPSSQLWQGRLV